MKLLIETCEFPKDPSPRELLTRKETSAEHLIAVGTVVNRAATSASSCRNTRVFLNANKPKRFSKRADPFPRTPSALTLTARKNGRDGFQPSRPSCEPNLNRIYGSVSSQALRPCVAAYSFRALGAIVRPLTSTMGRPVPATSQLVEPFGSLRTPQSLET